MDNKRIVELLNELQESVELSKYNKGLDNYNPKYSPYLDERKKHFEFTVEEWIKRVCDELNE